MCAPFPLSSTLLHYRLYRSKTSYYPLRVTSFAAGKPVRRPKQQPPLRGSCCLSARVKPQSLVYVVTMLLLWIAVRLIARWGIVWIIANWWAALDALCSVFNAKFEILVGTLAVEVVKTSALQ